MSNFKFMLNPGFVLGALGGLGLLVGALWPARLLPNPAFLPNAVVVLISSFFICIYSIVGGKIIPWRWNYFSLGLGIIFFGILLRPIVYPDLLYSEELIFPLVVVGLAFLLSVISSGIDDSRKEDVLSVWVFFLILAAQFSFLLQMLQWRVSGEYLPWWVIKLPPKFQPFGNYAQRNQLSLLYSMAVIGCNYIFGNKNNLKFLRIFIVLSCIFGVALSGSRTGMILSAIAFSTESLLRKKADFLQENEWMFFAKKISIDLLIFIFLFVFFQWIVYVIPGVHNFQNTIVRVEDSNDWTRFALQEQALHMFFLNPLFGAGWGTFSEKGLEFIVKSRLPIFADNSHFYFSQLLAELGLAGLAASCLFTLGVFYLLRNACSRLYLAVALLLLVVWMASLTEYPMWLAFFLLPVSVLSGFSKNEKNGVAVLFEKNFYFRRWMLFFAGLAVTFGAVWSIVEYKNINSIGNGIFGVKDVSTKVRNDVDRREWAFGFYSIYDMYSYVLIPVDSVRIGEKIALGNRVLTRYVNSDFLLKQTALEIIAGDQRKAFELMRSSCLLHPVRCDEQIKIITSIGSQGFPLATEMAIDLNSWWADARKKDVWLRNRMNR